MAPNNWQLSKWFSKVLKCGSQKSKIQSNDLVKDCQFFAGYFHENHWIFEGFEKLELKVIKKI